jgi:hypothetical protein
MNKKQTGKVNFVWVLAGGYLLYLAAQLFINVFRGTSDSPALGIGGGVAFTVIGAGPMWREWRAYKFGMDHIDDPSTWSDEESGEEEDHGD